MIIVSLLLHGFHLYVSETTGSDKGDLEPVESCEYSQLLFSFSVLKPFPMRFLLNNETLIFLHYTASTLGERVHAVEDLVSVLG